MKFDFCLSLSMFMSYPSIYLLIYLLIFNSSVSQVTLEKQQQPQAWSTFSCGWSSCMPWDTTPTTIKTSSSTSNMFNLFNQWIVGFMRQTKLPCAESFSIRLSAASTSCVIWLLLIEVKLHVQTLESHINNRACISLSPQSAYVTTVHSDRRYHNHKG